MKWEISAFNKIFNLRMNLNICLYIVVATLYTLVVQEFQSKQHQVENYLYSSSHLKLKNYDEFGKDAIQSSLYLVEYPSLSWFWRGHLLWVETSETPNCASIDKLQFELISWVGVGHKMTAWKNWSIFFKRKQMSPLFIVSTSNEVKCFFPNIWSTD